MLAKIYKEKIASRAFCFCKKIFLLEKYDLHSILRQIGAKFEPTFPFQTSSTLEIDFRKAVHR